MMATFLPFDQREITIFIVENFHVDIPFRKFNGETILPKIALMKSRFDAMSRSKLIHDHNDPSRLKINETC